MSTPRESARELADIAPPLTQAQAEAAARILAAAHKKRQAAESDKSP